MNRLLRWYFGVSLVLRLLAGFAAGAVIGIVLWKVSEHSGSTIGANAVKYVSPFGAVFVHMLRMVVIPVVFFSLISGAASLPIAKFGRVGVKTIGWYLLCSLLAAVVGTFIALAVNPGGGDELAKWETMAEGVGVKADKIVGELESEGALTKILFNLFQNPFEALASNNFLPVIVFAIMFGLAIRVVIEKHEGGEQARRLGRLIETVEACRDAMFKVVDWILEYSPIGVLALTMVNFITYGSAIAGTYVVVVIGIVLGICVMVFVVYPVLLGLVIRRNPFKVMVELQEAMLMAFTTRSSAAALPVSIKVAEEQLGVHNELASFSLPLGATINMDGVCVHLPMFAVLAANMFGIELTVGSLAVLVITTVLASIGAGGVPGGSLMLLFIILETMGLSAEQVAIVVALALGINPILDMFETMNNVTGDLVCTYAVAHNEGLIDDEGKE
ncbi:MAG: dicarboxylate/amino acid:cation symporter [Anaerohalosphaera sp.]|nr:dicarboxylate/amino acid:cation symporter [Anaerohalosphaera sp.]